MNERKNIVALMTTCKTKKMSWEGGNCPPPAAPLRTPLRQGDLAPSPLTEFNASPLKNAFPAMGNSQDVQKFT